MISRSRINYIVNSGNKVSLSRDLEKFIPLSRENSSCYFEIISRDLEKTNKKNPKQMKLTCFHGKREEIKCMNAWPYRASVEFIFLMT